MHCRTAFPEKVRGKERGRAQGREHRGRYSVQTRFNRKIRVVAGFHARHSVIHPTHRPVSLCCVRCKSCGVLCLSDLFLTCGEAC